MASSSSKPSTPANPSPRPRVYLINFDRRFYSTKGLREVNPCWLTLLCKCGTCTTSFKVEIPWVRGKPDIQKVEIVCCKCNEKMEITNDPLGNYVLIPEVLAKISVTGNLKFTRNNLRNEYVEWTAELAVTGKEEKFTTLSGSWDKKAINDKGEEYVIASCSGPPSITIEEIGISKK